MRALHTAATGMVAQELNVQVIANNIANMRTTGYKRQRTEFQDLLYEQVRRVGTQTSDQGNILPSGIELGAGVKTVGTPRIMSQGNLLPTSKELDVAIRGDGFFRILLPDGRTAYSRDGSFGTDTTPTQLGQIELSMFVNKSGLQAIGDNLYLETPASGTPQNGTPNTDGYGDLQQGNLEQANVEPVKEISDLIAAQRAYEMNAKVITACNEMLSATSNLMR
jgi:flagellar basal-body rod protein FlgG